MSEEINDTSIADTAPIETAPVDATPVDTTSIIAPTTAQADAEQSPPPIEQPVDTFDAAEYEAAFGLPAGSLANVANADQALKVIRDLTDEALVRGLAPKQEEPVAQPSELEQLQRQIAVLQRNELERHYQELDRRAHAEINSWASPTYGVGNTRTNEQRLAAQALYQAAFVTATGYAALGQDSPPIEKLLQRIRVQDGKAPAKSALPLGTPGRGKESVKPSNFSNIHQKLINNKS